MSYARTVVDIWAAKQPDEPKRSEAIRRLVEFGLKAKNSKGGIHEHRSSRTKHNDLSGLIGPYCARATLFFRCPKHARRILDGARRLLCDGNWHNHENVGSRSRFELRYEPIPAKGGL